jgi:FAD synthase
VNIFDFNEDIYGKNLLISIVGFLRGEVKFSGLEALKTQLNEDRNKAILLLQ